MSFEQAREFLARVIAWPQDGDATAYTNLHWKFFPQDGNARKDKHGNDILPWAGRAVLSLDDAIRALDFGVKSAGTRDIYLCLSTQSQAEERAWSKGGKWYKPIRFQENVVKLKSLFLDIDAKGSDKNSYANLGEAVAALSKFIADSGIPKPTLIVKSGGGLHVYWTLARALTRFEWQPLAFALAEATKRHGLKCDTQCTIDSARVLRVPDTLNYKTDPPKPVTLAGKPREFDYSIERLQGALDPYKVEIPSAQASPFLDPALFPPRPPLPKGSNSELIDGLKQEFDPVHLDDLAAECGFIREAIATGGLTYTNPMWNLTTLIASFSDDARNDAHRMGNQHPGYTKETTDEFFDRKAREKEEKGLGFPSCVTISGTGCTLCQSCPHFTKGRSPLAAQRPRVPAAPAPAGAVSGAGPNSAGMAFGGPLAPPPGVSQVDLPEGYIRDAAGRVCKIEHKETGDELVPVSEYSMSDGWIQTPGWIFHFNTTVERGQVDPITIPCRAVGSFDMRSTLQEQGFMVPVGPKQQERLATFMQSWITRLQQTRDTIKTAPFGWTVEGGKVNGFVFSGTVWMANGTRPAAAGSPVIAGHYAPTGIIDPWREMADIVTSAGKQDVAALLASSFAAPLVRFTGHAGVLMSAYSTESGVGKSTALKTAQAVWGHPRKAVQMLTDTQNSVMGKLGELRSLPLYWDELKTEEDTKKFVNITFQTTAGKEKSRMTRNATQREPGAWQTLLISASNDSLLDYILQSTATTTAGLYRIFEFIVGPRPPSAPVIPSSEVDLKLGRLDDNFGHAGLEYAKFLGANHQTIEAEVAACSSAFEDELETTKEERFWLALIVTICMGAKYANQIGLTKFDLDALKGFMVQCLETMRRHREAQPVDMNKEINLSTLLQRFLAAHRARHTIITNRIHTARGKPPRGSITIVSDVTKLDGIYVHIGMDDKKLRISSTRLSEWLREIKYPREAFLTKIEQVLGMRKMSGRIASGTQYAGFDEHLLEIDLAGTPLLDFIDES